MRTVSTWTVTVFDADGDGNIDVDSSGLLYAIGQDGSACDINIAGINSNGIADDVNLEISPK